MRRHRQPLTPALIVGLGCFWIWVCVNPWAAAQDAGASTLTFEPATLTCNQGRTASAKVTVALKSGKTGATTLKAADLPGGLAIAFDPPSGEPTFTSTMRVSATPTAKTGTYTVKIQASGSDPSSAVSYTVTVERSGGY
jgi:hypothetical protein